jgi:hypothetical protein
MDTTEELRRHYLRFLDTHSPRHSPVNWDENPFIISEDAEQRLTEAFSAGVLDDLNQSDTLGASYAPEIRSRKISAAREALADLVSLNPDLEVIFGLAIHTIFLRASSRSQTTRGSFGGSSSSAIGTIWMTVDDVLQRGDLMEMFVHELAHHLLFIDELNNGHFNYQAISDPANFATSAILKRNRPLDKVVHSIVVAVELLQARQLYLDGHTGPVKVHSPTLQLRSDTLAAIESVRSLANLEHLVLPRVRDILDRSENVCARAS